MKQLSILGVMSLVILNFGIFTACTQKVDVKKTVYKPYVAKKIQPFDVNGDGKNDAWRHYKFIDGKKILTHKVFDLNFDQRKDLRRFYNDSGEVLRDEMDMDFDGVFDVVCFYEGNQLVRKELMTLRGKSADSVLMLKEYKDGSVNYVESDQDHDGVKDTFFYFKEGRIVRRGFDENRDGKPDRWIDLEE